MSDKPEATKIGSREAEVLRAAVPLGRVPMMTLHHRPCLRAAQSLERKGMLYRADGVWFLTSAGREATRG